MWVHVKTPRTELEIKGDISHRLMDALKKDFGTELNVRSEDDNNDDDELVDVFETDWYKEIHSAMTPGKYLGVDRYNAGLTQAELGRKLGNFSRQYISDLEHGRKNISLKVAKKLADLFDRPVDRYI